jgi:hypothetical protein
LVESVALIQTRLDFQVLEEFVSSIDNLMGIVWVGEDLHQRAWKLLNKETEAAQL